MKNMLGKFLAVSVFAAFAAGSAYAGCNRDQGRQYCTGDALKLCSAFIPDETKIQACLKQNLNKLSPDCKKCFSSFEETMGWTN